MSYALQSKRLKISTGSSGQRGEEATDQASLTGGFGCCFLNGWGHNRKRGSRSLQLVRRQKREQPGAERLAGNLALYGG